jgi:hypothetical protein
MDKKQFAFGKKNFMLLAISVAFIILGFVLVSGGKTTEATGFDPSIFNVRRLLIAPVVIMSGFGLIIYAILTKTKE